MSKSGFWIVATAVLLLPSLANAGAFEKAVAFAITGKDDTPYVAEDRDDCVFRFDGQRSAGDGPTQSIQVYHLNNVDPKRIMLKQFTQKYPNGSTSEYVTVELYGESTIFEDRAVYVWKSLNQTDGPTKSSQHNLVIYTNEFARLQRAWNYIYTHGCTGSKSSF